MKKTLGDIIKSFRDENNMSMDDFAKISNLSKGYISMLEKNENPSNKKPITPSLDTYNSVAKALNTDIDTLLNLVDSEEPIRLSINRNKNVFNIPNILKIKPSTKKIPLLGTIAAGAPILAEENIEDYVDLDKKIQADFALRIKGDSMINANIKDGDIVFIHKQSDVDDGDIAAVLIEDSATLKRVFKIGGIIQLRAENSKYPPITLNGDKSVYILGKATYKLSEVL